MADDGKCICCQKEIFEEQDYTTLICHAVGQAMSHTTLAHDKCWEKFARAARRSSGSCLGASHPGLPPAPRHAPRACPAGGLPQGHQPAPRGSSSPPSPALTPPAAPPTPPHLGSCPALLPRAPSPLAEEELCSWTRHLEPHAVILLPRRRLPQRAAAPAPFGAQEDACLWIRGSHRAQEGRRPVHRHRRGR
jgi:hypothetical protein